MNNKPKYHFFKNTKYAYDGLVHAIANETSFRIELIGLIVILPILYFIPILFIYKLTLLVTYMLILVVELINSSIENVVDLVTEEIHPLAKSAKDIGATAVMFTIFLHILCWVVILFESYCR